MVKIIETLEIKARIKKIHYDNAHFKANDCNLYAIVSVYFNVVLLTYLLNYFVCNKMFIL